jgi:hypothetical protein
MSKDKKDLSEIENKLKNYFRKDPVIVAKNKQLEKIVKCIEELEQQMKTNNYNIPEESSSPTWGDKVQTSSNGTSYVERELMNIVSRKEVELGDWYKKKYSLESEIRQIEIDCAELETNISLLDEDNIKLLKMKYGDNKTDLEIGYLLAMEQPGVTKRRRRLLEDIAKWDKWIS